MSFDILGTGSRVPRKVVTNDELTEFLDTSDEWIHTRTGIRRRHVLTDETLHSLAVEAAQSALDSAGVRAEEIERLLQKDTYLLCVSHASNVNGKSQKLYALGELARQKNLLFYPVGHGL